MRTHTHTHTLCLHISCIVSLFVSSCQMLFIGNDCGETPNDIQTLYVWVPEETQGKPKVLHWYLASKTTKCKCGRWIFSSPKFHYELNSFFTFLSLSKFKRARWTLAHQFDVHCIWLDDLMVDHIAVPFWNGLKILHQVRLSELNERTNERAEWVSEWVIICKYMCVRNCMASKHITHKSFNK